jgi:hypothetical protein
MFFNKRMGHVKFSKKLSKIEGKEMLHTCKYLEDARMYLFEI